MITDGVSHQHPYFFCHGLVSRTSRKSIMTTTEFWLLLVFDIVPFTYLYIISVLKKWMKVVKNVLVDRYFYNFFFPYLTNKVSLNGHGKIFIYTMFLNMI